MNKKKYLIRSFFVFVLLSSFFLSATYFYNKGKNYSTSESEFWSEIDNQTHYVTEPSFLLDEDNDAIIENLNGHSRQLFNNIKGVQAIYLGPDKKTLHFLVNSENSKEGKCIDLKTKVEPYAPDELRAINENARINKTQPKIVKATTPWNFKDINYHSLSRCTSGYTVVNDKVFFSFLKIDLGREKLANIVLFDLINNKQYQLPVKNEQLIGLRTSLTNETIYEYSSQGNPQEQAGAIFYYPEQIIEINNELLGFFVNGKIFTLNLKTEKVDSTIDLPNLNSDLKVSACGQNILSNKNGIIVINKYWCESSRLSAIVDFTKDSMRPTIVDISKYDIEPSHWFTNEYILQLKEEGISITNPIVKEVSDPNHDTECDTATDNFEKINQRYTEETKRLYPNYSVECNVCGMGQGCFIMTGKKQYTYTTQNGFKELQ